MAESVHQVVQGNYARARGAMQALTDGESPPDPDVVKTPRSGRLVDASRGPAIGPGVNATWLGAPTPRARANPAVNSWLVSMLPAAADIEWRVTDGTLMPQRVDAASLDLEPIDLVLLCGDTLGEQSSELERFIVHSFRQSAGVADDRRAFFAGRVAATVPPAERLVFDPSTAAAGKHSLASIWPLLKALKHVVSRARPLNAADFVLPSEATKTNLADPRGYGDLNDLKTRVDAAHTVLTGLGKALRTFLDVTVAPVFNALKEDPNGVLVPSWPGILTPLRKQLLDLWRSGIGEALPVSTQAVDEPAIDALVMQAETVSKALAARLAEARKFLDISFPGPVPAEQYALGDRLERRLQSYLGAAKQLLGRAFIALPAFTLHAASRTEVANGLAVPIEDDASVVEEWLQSLTRVRPAVGAFSWAATYHDWLHADAMDLVPLQIPVRSGDTWVAREYGAAMKSGEVVSLLLSSHDVAPIHQAQCGLVVDEWTENVPAPQETTGLAFHADPPNAQPPQTLLLAVPPVLRGTWRWDDLPTIVTETLHRAKQRAVEPEHIATTDLFQMLPTVLTEFSNVYASMQLSESRTVFASAAAQPRT